MGYNRAGSKHKPQLQCAVCLAWYPQRKDGKLYSHKRRLKSDERAALQEAKQGQRLTYREQYPVCEALPLGHVCPACDGSGVVRDAGELA